jgi:hypothetical protein
MDWRTRYERLSVPLSERLRAKAGDLRDVGDEENAALMTKAADEIDRLTHELGKSSKPRSMSFPSGTRISSPTRRKQESA